MTASTRFLSIAGALVAASGALASPASAGVIASLDTGVDSGTTSLLSPGALDSRYQLVASSDGSLPGPSLFVLAPVGGPSAFPIGYWLPEGPSSQWLVPYANGVVSLATVSPGGSYVYRTTFDLTGFDLQDVRIAGSWAVDEAGVDIRLNGVSSGQATAVTGAGAFGNSGFASFTPFAFASGFVNGINTLDFVTTNIDQSTGNPIGIRVEGSVAVVPEPGSLALMLAGIAAVSGASMRRRNRAGLP